MIAERSLLVQAQASANESFDSAAQLLTQLRVDEHTASVCTKCDWVARRARSETVRDAKLGLASCMSTVVRDVLERHAFMSMGMAAQRTRAGPTEACPEGAERSC